LKAPLPDGEQQRHFGTVLCKKGQNRFTVNKPYDMKKRFFAAVAALTVTAAVHAQSTVDSIAAKYKLLPMPSATTLERAFPVLGTYQLTNATEGTGTITVTLDSTNKGLVWVEGLPQGRIKAYLRKSPSTYRILSQKSGDGKQVSEGTLHFDTTSRNLHIALGKAYDDADPTAIFALTPDMSAAGAEGESEVKIKTKDTKVKTEVEGNQVKVKTKTPVSKTKTKVLFYTATKIEQVQDTLSDQGNMSDPMSTDNTQTEQSDASQLSGSTENGSAQQSDSTQQTQTPQQ
jgi:hypothetical protein